MIHTVLRRRRRSTHDRALTLVEVVVAMGVLTIMLLALAATMISSVSLNEYMGEQRSASSLAEGALNYVIANKDFRGTYADLAGAPLPKDNASATNVWQLPFSSLRDLEFDKLSDYSGDLTIVAYAFDASTTPPGPPTVVTDWLAADFFEVLVTVSWVPTVNKRNSSTATRSIKLKTLYFPQSS
ncbi:MAG: hypothetical protein AB7N76_23200 [Planctomycetota bacterium]